MSTVTEDVVRTCEALPLVKQMEVADFARFLLDRMDDDKWDQTIAENKPRPRLETFLRESASEGETPLELHRL